jgi:iron complex transport system ATP-binding protein
MMDDLLLSADRISMRWDGRSILDRLSLQIRPGEFVGLIGPNGAGKTTLLRLIAKLLEPTGGALFLEGNALAPLRQREVAKRVAVVPQATTTEFGFPALEAVLMGRHPHLGRFHAETAEDYRIAREAMALTETLPFAERPVTELSGGERQRVIVARALAQQPRLLLLDEPTANLDLCHQIQVLELVRRLVRQGPAAVAALHDLELASRYCERLVLLRAGVVLAEGPPAEVLTVERLAEAFGIKASVSPNPLTGGLSISVLSAVADGANKV